MSLVVLSGWWWTTGLIAQLGPWEIRDRGREFAALAAVAQHGDLGTPLAAFHGWATCGFAIARRERVAYLYMPKAGSTTIRRALVSSYGLQMRGIFPGGLHPDDTFFALPGSAFSREWMLSFYQGRFVPGPPSGESVVSAQSVSNLSGYYRFTFVTDPVDHLVRGICEVLSWRRGQMCMRAVRENRISAELRGLFGRTVSQIYGALSGDGTSLDCHYAPQLWLLRAAASCGVQLDFVSKLNASSWTYLQHDMAAHGFTPPGPLLSEERKRSFANLTRMLFRTASFATVRKACATVAGEYRLLRIPPRKDGICASDERVYSVRGVQSSQSAPQGEGLYQWLTATGWLW